MSDTQELKVTATADTGIRNQWARGLFYRSDGRKRTLISKNVLIVGAIAFGVVVIFLLFQGTPELDHNAGTTETVAPPSELTTGSVVNVPTAAEARNSTDSSVTGETTSGSQESAAVPPRKHGSLFRGPQLIARPRTIKIPPGSMIKAVLLSGASNGPVRAEITEGLTIAGERVVEEGAILLGQGQSGDDRLSIRFSQMVYKDGAVETIDAQGCDASDKIPGIKGSKIGGQALRLATGIGLTFVGGMADVLQDSSGQNGTVVRAPTLKNAMLNGAATAALDQSREILANTRNKPPVIEIPSGTSLFILFQKD